MITQYGIRCFKDNNRVSPSQFDDVESRLFYAELKRFMHDFEILYGNSLNETSIMIRIDEREIYRSKERMLEYNILTIEDMINYLNIENVLYVIKNNNLITDMSTIISDAYVLEIYTCESLLTPKQLTRINEVNHG